MFFSKDNTYNDIRDKSLNQWLDEMEQHEDVAVRGGVKLTREYMQYLKSEIKRLEEENELKNQYLKKMSHFQPQKKQKCHKRKVFKKFKQSVLLDI